MNIALRMDPKDDAWLEEDPPTLEELLAMENPDVASGRYAIKKMFEYARTIERLVEANKVLTEDIIKLNTEIDELEGELDIARNESSAF
jgi:predicted RNase H-like nuclease (RuvC/YqgF family)